MSTKYIFTLQKRREQLFWSKTRSLPIPPPFESSLVSEILDGFYLNVCVNEKQNLSIYIYVPNEEKTNIFCVLASKCQKRENKNEKKKKHLLITKIIYTTKTCIFKVKPISKFYSAKKNYIKKNRIIYNLKHIYWLIFKNKFDVHKCCG